MLKLVCKTKNITSKLIIVQNKCFKLAAVGIATVGIAELWQRWESQSCDGSGWDLGTWEEEKSCHPILRKKK
jgi:hypothetical protein